MKVYNSKILMTDFLRTKLEEYRNVRGFIVEDWVDQKVDLINKYFTVCGLSAAVVGVSGGVDSSVVLALLVKASQRSGSSLKKVVPLLLPAENYEGATNQDEAVSQAMKLCERLGVQSRKFGKLKEVSNIISSELSLILDEGETPWSKGQLVAYARTPILYNATSMLTDAGYPALVAGTTNLSEGGYLGYVGKASDGMVDLQIISDLYKSEVYEVAKFLDLPEVIISAVPTGDMFDGRNDEEVFGASYDFVELYHLWLQNGSDPELLEDTHFVEGRNNLEKLHLYNKHKYSYGSSSVHLDLLDAHIPGGWHNNPWSADVN